VKWRRAAPWPVPPRLSPPVGPIYHLVGGVRHRYPITVIRIPTPHTPIDCLHHEERVSLWKILLGRIKAGRIPRAVAALRQAIRYSASDDDIARKAREELQFLEKLVKDTTPFQTLDTYVENQELFDLAFENLTARRYEAATDLFTRVLAQNPGHVQSHGNLALAYAGLGRKALALEHLDKALALDSAYEPAIQNRKIIKSMKEGEPHRPVAIAETEYYRDRLEAEKSPAHGSWWQRIKRLTTG